ncbi:MAG TPA: beta-galactosidase trimerization domain-containing protein, partial [Clostridia bacterium]|nr:beta-galactosidase trimerization domain-containing protein [Clostridia bacterium]
FDEALPPPTQGHAPAPDANRAAWFDWADWNMRRFTDHLKWAYRDIRSLHPDMPICAGGTHSMLSANIGTTGIDEELIINEVDDVILHEGNDPMGIDLFHALSDRPRPLVDPEQGGGCEGWLLNYLHGKSTIAMFWWPRQPSRQFSSSTLLSPAHGDMSIPKVLEHLTTALDVRRIGEEIVAFWDLPKEVAIVYSRSTMIQVDPRMMSAHETPYLKALRGSYDAARCLDAGLTFVSERQLAAGKAKAYKLILLPAVRHVPEAVFEALDRYAAEGGTLVVLPESLLCDEYNRPMEYLARWGISKATGKAAGATTRTSSAPYISGRASAGRPHGFPAIWGPSPLRSPACFSAWKRAGRPRRGDRKARPWSCTSQGARATSGI